jgi:cellobiose phosphorylase
MAATRTRSLKGYRLKRFATKYGNFSTDGREYHIKTPKTPRPWINVISNGDYGLTLSQTGGGYSWRTHAQLNRLTRWEQDLIKDEWGKYIYLRDEKGDVWSAGWKPVCAEPDYYLCCHGIGYSTITSRRNGIESEVLVFVPRDEPCEIWKLTLRNLSSKPRVIDIFTYFEWCLGASPDWHREFHKSFIETSQQHGALFAAKRLWEVPTDRGHWNTDWPYLAFHASSIKPSSYDCDKESFLGRYGSVAMPAAVKKGSLNKRAGNWLDPVASLNVNVTIPANSERVVCFTLGAADSKEQADRLIQKYRSPRNVDTALEEVTAHWEKLLDTVKIETPDEAMNLMENYWLKYQAISGRLWGRTAYYQTGGAFGFRDQLQDSQIFLPIDPEKTRDQIRLHARHQFNDGTVYHWWHPITEVGLHTTISDDLLWLPFVVKSYLDETGDFTILDVEEPFVDGGKRVPLYDHCVRAIDCALARFSKRGLPLIGAGDWNDGLSAVGLDMKGESVWLGHFLHRILLDFGDVSERRGDAVRAESYRARAGKLKKTINAIAWDGKWFYRGTKDSGEKFGSSRNAKGKLYLNAQTWAVIAGIADEKRANAVMDIVEKILEYKAGPLLLTPAYKTPDKNIGYLSRYAPGMRENGGVYTHAAAWSVIAEAMLGRGKSAFRIYSKLNPVNRGKTPDEYDAEPYVTSGNIEGPDSPFYGRGGWSWYTGSAAWLFKVGLEWILGIRPSVDGLIVNPCIPRSWKTFTVRRQFRGATYRIEVNNPHGVEHGVSAYAIDGKPRLLPGDRNLVTLPVFEAGSTHSIVVTLGPSTGKK